MTTIDTIERIDLPEKIELIMLDKWYDANDDFFSLCNDDAAEWYRAQGYDLRYQYYEHDHSQLARWTIPEDQYTFFLLSL